MINLLQHFMGLVTATEPKEQNAQFLALVEEQYQTDGLTRREYLALVNQQPFAA